MKAVRVEPVEVTTHAGEVRHVRLRYGSALRFDGLADLDAVEVARSPASWVARVPAVVVVCRNPVGAAVIRVRTTTPIGEYILFTVYNYIRYYCTEPNTLVFRTEPSTAVRTAF